MRKAQPTRRNFLKTIAATTVAVPAIVPSPVLGANAPGDKFTIAFIGTGNNGTNWLRPFLGDSRCRVVAVCDVNKEGPGYWGGSVRGRDPAQRLVNDHYKDKSCAAYGDFREVIARDDVDGIYIGTPDHWHAVIAIAAADAKKDIYGQKPLTLTVAEGRAMVEAVERNKIVWQTGSQQRSDWRFRKACELVRNGRIGKINTVSCGLPGGIPDYGKTAHQTEPVPVPTGFNYDLWLGPAPRAPYCPARVGVNFRWILDYSGGQLTDWGAHHIDIAQWGLGTEDTGPVAIKNPTATWASHPVYNTATDYSFEGHYQNGVKLIVSNKVRGGVTFVGSEGSIWVNRGGLEATPKSVLDSEIKPGEVHLYKSDDHVRDFIDCVFTRKTPAAPIETAHRSVSIAHLGNIAMILGRDIAWDPKEEKIIGDAGANLLLNRGYRRPWVL